jgi:hypothetical protein
MYFSRYPGSDLPAERPFPATMIALFQFAKASFLALIALTAHYNADALREIPSMPALIYLAAHGRDVSGPLLPLVAIYTAIIGCGLWRLWRWARKSLIISSSLMVGLWTRKFILDWMAGDQSFRSTAEQQTIFFLLFLDLVVILYLAFYDDVPSAFNEPRY